jgi:ketosteroid isomerase-like protein
VKNRNTQLVESFFRAIAGGDLPEDLVTADMTFWSINSGESDKARFRAGVKILASIFGGTLTYRVESLISEDDRIAAEVLSQGTLKTGEPFHNSHVFLFQICDGRIASAREYMNQFIVREKIVPLMQAATTAS